MVSTCRLIIRWYRPFHRPMGGSEFILRRHRLQMSFVTLYFRFLTNFTSYAFGTFVEESDLKPAWGQILHFHNEFWLDIHLLLFCDLRTLLVAVAQSICLNISHLGAPGYFRRAQWCLVQVESHTSVPSTESFRQFCRDR